MKLKSQVITLLQSDLVVDMQKKINTWQIFVFNI